MNRVDPVIIATGNGWEKALWLNLCNLGLILVVVAGAELFTGNNLMVMALAGGRSLRC